MVAGVRRWSAVACLMVACDAGPDETSTGVAGTTNADAGTGVDASTGDGTTAVTTLPSTTAPFTTSTSTSTTTDDGTTQEPEPLGPGCSVQEVTRGELYDPLTRGTGFLEFPVQVADTLEDYCGCHTLMSGAQNIKWDMLRAPGGSLFLDYADLGRSYGDSTLGAAIEDQVAGYGMPPGSCGFPSEASDVFAAWFEQGMPDGSMYVPI